MSETNEIRALRRGMSLMPRFHLLDKDDVDDLLVKSGVGEWVRYKDMQAHYDVVVAIVLRATKRAEDAERKLREIEGEPSKSSLS